QVGAVSPQAPAAVVAGRADARGPADDDVARVQAVACGAQERDVLTCLHDPASYSNILSNIPPRSVAAVGDEPGQRVQFGGGGGVGAHGGQVGVGLGEQGRGVGGRPGAAARRVDEVGGAGHLVAGEGFVAQVEVRQFVACGGGRGEGGDHRQGLLAAVEVGVDGLAGDVRVAPDAEQV